MSKVLTAKHNQIRFAVKSNRFSQEDGTVPSNALLNEDGSPFLNEDGSYILVE